MCTGIPIASGDCPVKVIQVNGRIHVVTASLVEVLSGRGEADA